MSNWQAAEEGDLQDDLDLELEAKSIVEKDCILFVIDCSSEMFIPNIQLKPLSDDNEINNQNPNNQILSPFQAAMKCIASTMKNKIISSETDRIGVLCYGTSKSKNPAGFPSIYVLQDLAVPDAPSIKEIERFANRTEAFKTSIGSMDSEFPFGNVFWSIASIFSEKALAGTSKRIFLFTCEDNPNSKSEALKKAAKTRGKDLADLGIALELFSLPRATGKSFNSALFYKGIISDLIDEGTKDQDDQNMFISKFEELLAQVRRRETRKRALARTQMSLGSEMNFSVKLFSLYMETKKGQYVWMNERTGEVMAPKTEWICKETGKVLTPSEFKFSFDYGGEKIVFTKEEISKMYKFDEDLGLKVLGFKPRAVLKTSHNVTHSTFIYPDETIGGSVKVFRSLLKNCLEMNKLIICRYTARKGSPPRLVALLPQAEQIDQIGTQIKAPGFNMIILPFADDIRHLRFEVEEAQNIATHEQIDKAKALINQLSLPVKYDPKSYDNPVLQKHYANLQALALDEETEEAFEDQSIPNYERIKLRAEGLINEFKESIGWQDVSTIPPPELGNKSKRKSADDDADYDCIAAIRAVKNDSKALNKFTVADLKSYLESIGIKAKRIKSEIIDQIVCVCE